MIDLLRRNEILVMHLRIPPVFVALIGIVSMILLSKLLPQFALPLPFKLVFAIGLGIIGISIAGKGVVAFRRLQTTVNPTKPETASTLVVDGIYRRTRNPMYLGVLFCQVAVGIYLANVAALVIVPIVFVVYMNQFQIKPEEQALALIFGEDFKHYMAEVRRWL